MSTLCHSAPPPLPTHETYWNLPEHSRTFSFSFVSKVWNSCVYCLLSHPQTCGLVYCMEYIKLVSKVSLHLTETLQRIVDNFEILLWCRSSCLWFGSHSGMTRTCDSNVSRCPCHIHVWRQLVTNLWRQFGELWLTKLP